MPHNSEAEHIIKHPRLTAAFDTIKEHVTSPGTIVKRRAMSGGFGLSGKAAREIKDRQRRMDQPAGRRPNNMDDR